MQVLNNGVLVSLAHPIQYLPNKVIFIKTNKEYADQDLVGKIFVHSNGFMNYPTVLGVKKTVHSFKYLGDVKKKSKQSPLQCALCVILFLSNAEYF